MKKRVIFLCTHNSARSQMAEAYLSYFFPNKYEVFSAGITPTKINPLVVKVMAEEGIDLARARSKSVDEFIDIEMDLAVTVCDNAKEACPFFPATEIIHHGFRNPSQIGGSEEEKIKQIRMIRDEIKAWIQKKFY